MAKCIAYRCGGFLLCFATVACGSSTALHGQTSTSPKITGSQTEAGSAQMPAFEVSTIKPHDFNHGGMLGFISYPGGRVVVGAANLKMLLYFAFDLQSFQISGVPAWADKNRYDIEALPPASSESRTAVQPPMKATPSDEQRKMLQNLLVERFGLKFHRETKEGPVYLLLRGKGQLRLEAPAHPEGDSRGGVIMMQGGIADGSAFGLNISMPFLARQLSSNLDRPVLDRTGLPGLYDFQLEPDDPTNHDMTAAIVDAMNRLGLKLKAAKGPVETIVIDSVTEPTEN
ncbi:TIGR03435 family protein [Granulicella mallensis]|jgi:uncharacterized protein (TIGR03435 family)|uniref:TIGR03435 family protein n=1 Tax=Granulicella mallensis TaxID=940614 RepID=UPI00288942DA|nr:TIGR03435 family protein [Granulicella mallensis]